MHDRETLLPAANDLSNGVPKVETTETRQVCDGGHIGVVCRDEAREASANSLAVARIIAKVVDAYDGVAARGAQGWDWVAGDQIAGAIGDEGVYCATVHCTGHHAGPRQQ